MINLLVEIAKYLMIFLFAFYTFECFSVLGKHKTKEKQNDIFYRQTCNIYMIHFIGFFMLILINEDMKLILFYIMQALLISVIFLVYKLFYKDASRLLLNNMCMLLAIGFLVLTRLDTAKAIKQFFICVVAVVVSIAVPFCIEKIRFLQKLTWLYAAIGILSLGGVAVIGSISYGAKISISIGGISIQPSEFVKILYVFFIACMLQQSTSLKQIAIISVAAALHVLILVASKDLGAALIFFIVYLVMIYVATKKLSYFVGVFLLGCAAAVVAYKLFSHVQTRVIAWQDPLSVIDKQGYQICQSLFAISTGGWFGRGICKGVPKAIPVVEQDFIFSAISEELGGLFALCLILVCVSCFFMFMNISMQMRNTFYKLIALGLGTVYGFQVFLTIGGVTKFIPSTGVTLPLVSYGGSSLLSTMILFAIIQGLYILRKEGGDTDAYVSQEPEPIQYNDIDIFGNPYYNQFRE
ncbi:MAG: FtsW/RodA/SpoVE family cell cycle protein [Lachnospiraceae bacterium]